MIDEAEIILAGISEVEYSAEGLLGLKRGGGPWRVRTRPALHPTRRFPALRFIYCAVTVTVPRFIAAAPLVWAMTAT